jgi:hypothetical protein
VIWVSSSGRGLWTVNIDRKAGVDAARCPFPEAPPGGLPPDTLIVHDPLIFASRPFQGLQDTVVCPRCTVVLAKNGWLTDIQLGGDTVAGIAVSSGAVFQLDRTGTEVPLSVPNEYRDGSGQFPERSFGRGLTANRLIRGLVLEGRRLRAVLSSREELPFAPARTSLVYVHSLARTSEASTVRSGDSARISGTGFVPAQPVRILFDAEVVAPRVPVRADGTFAVDLRVERPRGEMVVWVEQRDGQRLTRQRATIEVRGAE